MQAEEISTYEEAVEYLYQIPKFTVKNALEDTKAFYQHLIEPDSKANIIHIAGTNGKGSVCAYLHSVLRKSEYRVGMFTSPHLIDIRERFLVNDKMVSKEIFLDAFCTVAGKIKEFHHPTFFEYLFLMAMLIFKKEKVDFIILETGLGGRLDSTNVVTKPLVCAITSVSLDHMQYLGDTVEQIAGEKAGIIKTGVPIVYSQREKAVSDVIIRTAKEKKAKSIGVSKSDYTLINFHHKSIDFSCQSRYYGYIRFTLHTSALYQMENAALAVRVIDYIKELSQGDKITRETLMLGMESAFWQGRMEEIEPGVYVDGAHNADGLKAFLESADAVECEGRKLLVFGAVADKEYEKMLSMIEKSHIFEGIFLTQIENARSVHTEQLSQIGRKCFKKEVPVFLKSVEALHEAKREKGQKDIVFVAGSLYLVGEVKALSGGNQND